MTATITRTTKKPVVQHIEALAAKLADARAQKKRWEALEAELSEKLIEAHTAGVVPTKFKASGWSFSFQEGRQTVQFPPEVAAEIKFIQAAAVEAGITTVKVGNPFWRITPVKETKPKA